MTFILRIVCSSLLLLAMAGRSLGDEEQLRALISKLAVSKGFLQTGAIVGELAATGDPAVERSLEALAGGRLYFRKADKQVFIATEGSGFSHSRPR